MQSRINNQQSPGIMDNYIFSDSQTSNILIVDDEPIIRDMLKYIMKGTGHSCHFAENGAKALKLLSDQVFDVVVTDVEMPVMNGIELVKIIKSKFTADIIVMTGQITNYQYDEFINIGASDFVTKPFSPKEIVHRINRVLKERTHKQEARKIRDALKESDIDSIHRLVMAAEYKDEETGDHIVRIGQYGSLMAEKLNLSTEYRETIYYASPMHDIGKIGIPDKILSKPGKLSHVEFEIIKTHTQIGARLLSNSNSRILQMAREIAMTHHEKFNGNGYPDQLKAFDIPISGRITALADTFDALTSKRPYKNPYPPEVTLDILRKERGKHFDPDILDIFISNFDKFIEIRGKFGTFQGEIFKDVMFSERDRAS